MYVKMPRSTLAGKQTQRPEVGFVALVAWKLALLTVAVVNPWGPCLVANAQWTQLGNLANTGPSPLEGAAAVYCGEMDEFVVMGGFGDSSNWDFKNGEFG